MSRELPPMDFVVDRIVRVWASASDNYHKGMWHSDADQIAVDWYREYAALYDKETFDAQIKAVAKSKGVYMYFDNLEFAVSDYRKYPLHKTEIPGVERAIAEAKKLAAQTDGLRINNSSKLAVLPYVDAPIKFMAEFKEAKRLVQPLIDNHTLTAEAGHEYPYVVGTIKTLQAAELYLNPVTGYPLFKQWAEKYHVPNALQEVLDPTPVSKSNQVFAPEA